MNEQSKASVPTEAELRAAWQNAGGTIYSANHEIGSMPWRKLRQFLGRLMQPAFIQLSTSAEFDMDKLKELLAKEQPMPMTTGFLEAGPVYASDIELALRALIDAACPGLDSGDILEDARKATEAFGVAELAGHFGIEEKPAADGSNRHVMVAAQYASDPDVFPLYRHAPRADAAAAAPAPAPAPRAPRAAAKKTAGAAGGAS